MSGNLLCVGDGGSERRWVGCRGDGRKVAVHELIEERLAQTVHGVLAPPAVEVVEDADALLRQKIELRVEEDRIAAVSDHGAAIPDLVEETVGHRAESRQGGLRRRVHQLRGLCAEHRVIAETPLLQMREHEVRHVRCGRRHASGGTRNDELVGLRGRRSRSVAIGHGALETIGQGLIEGRMPHVERQQNVLLDIALEGLTRDSLHDVTGK